MEPIPDQWRQDVIRALKTNDDKIIEWTPPAFQRWKTDTFGAWKGEVYDAMIDALSNEAIEGNETTSMPGQLATYEFLFPRGSMLMYGKIALKNGRVRVLVLSAHKAERKTLRP